VIITVKQNGDDGFVGRIWKAVLCNRESFALASKGERIIMAVFRDESQPELIVVFHGKECVAEACISIDDLLHGLPEKVRTEIFPSA
jgi:hypothetical protein